MKIKVLKNGCEDNIQAPKQVNDVGYDMRAAKITIKGKGWDFSEKKEISQASLEKADVTAWASIDFIEYDTGVVIEPDCDEQGLLYTAIQPNSRNGKMNLLLSNSRGIVDPSYRGTIRFRYKYVFQPSDLSIVEGQIVGTIDLDKIYKVGDVCGQASFHSPVYPSLESVEKLSETERGEGGFGSTGK